MSVTSKSARWHWPEYGIEAAGLGLFMVSAAFFTVLLQHPASPFTAALPWPPVRRFFMGIAMGSTAAFLIYSKPGARSGAHLNPATTLTFARLGKMRSRDAVLYAVAQVLGGAAGLAAAAVLLRPWIADPDVNYAATQPGMWGVTAAFGAEGLISFLLMTTVLHVSNSRFARLTGAAAGLAVALFILVEEPVSGMSMNPARSLAPALVSGQFDGLWVYFLAPPAGMLVAAELFVRRNGLHRVFCAKLNHTGRSRCIFNCHFEELATVPPPERAIA